MRSGLRRLFKKRENTFMRTVSKSLLTLSICLGLSGAVYAQSTPSTSKPTPAGEATKAKPAVPETAKVKPVAKADSKDKPAAVSGENTPATKTPKHEHATHAQKPAVEKSNTKAESPDAKKLDSSTAKESKKPAKHEGTKAASKPADKAPTESAVHSVK
jgi:hypothetical protein